MRLLDRRRLLTSGAAAAVFAGTAIPGLGPAKRGGRLRAGLSGGSPEDSWDARNHAGLFMIAAAQGAVFDTLTEVAPDGSLRGELATRWQARADARVWTVDLRQDAVFHNGRPFSAEDVIASLELHLDPRVCSPVRSLVAEMIEIRKISNYQVRLTLIDGNVDLPYLLADYHLLMYPAGQIAQAMAEGIGTGLYKVEHFEPGHRFIGQRVHEHYRDGQSGWFDEVDFIALNSRAERREALQTRRVDVADQLTTMPFEIPHIRLKKVIGNQHLRLAVTDRATPDQAWNLIRGLKHGLDRQALLDRLFDGAGRLGADAPIGPANRSFDAGLLPLSFDPEVARAHFASAGFGHEKVLCVALPTSAPFTVAELADLSLDLLPGSRQQLRFVPAAASDPPAEVEMSLGYGRAIEDWALSTGPGKALGWMLQRLPSTQFDRQRRAARSERDSAIRRRYYINMQHQLRDAGMMVVPVFADFSHAVHSRLASPSQIGSLWPLDNGRLAERWWMA